jgi:integrase/recombinase XerC
MYLAWLADGTGRRRYRGDTLTNPTARDWAIRDYRLYLLREATPKRSVRYSNDALVALDDFYVRLGLGKANVGPDELPKTAPKAMDARAEIRWLRAVESWPHARDRALALLLFYAAGRPRLSSPWRPPPPRSSSTGRSPQKRGAGRGVRSPARHPRPRRPSMPDHL